MRHFDFSPSVKREVIDRQSNRCARCGHKLNDVEDSAHHVVPDQSGEKDSPSDRFLRYADNCVYLCYLCHEAVHGGNTQTGPVAPPSYFIYSHGSNRPAHSAWVARLDRYIEAKYKK
ncbi:hypothetical protein ACVWXL_005871 [Bradyrhizobium sp. GM22.5]